MLAILTFGTTCAASAATQEIENRIEVGSDGPLEAQLRKDLARASERNDLRLRLAQLLERNGRSEEALKLYAEARAKQPDLREAYLGPVRIYVAQGDEQHAHASFDAFQDRFPGEDDAIRVALLSVEAEEHRSAGQYAKAVASYRDALKIDPRDPRLWNGLAGIYFAARQLPAALQAFQVAAQADANDIDATNGQVDVLTAMASESLNRGDHEAANSYLDQATKVGGDNQHTSTSYPHPGPNREQPKAAPSANASSTAAAPRPQARQATKVAPVVSTAAEVKALKRARALLDSGRTDKAFDATRAALARNPENPGSLKLLASIYSKRGQWSDAIETHRAVLAANPDDPDSLQGIADAYEARRAENRATRQRLKSEGRLDQVYLSLAQDYRSDPSDVDTLKSIGLLYLQTKQYAEAKQFFARAQGLAPQDSDARIGLAYALRGSGNKRDAVDILESEYVTHRDPELGLALAEMYHELGRDDDAAQVLEEAQRRGGVVTTRGGLPSAGEAGYSSSQSTGSILPPLNLPEGVLSAPPQLGPATPRRWRGSSARAQLATQRLAFAAASDSMNDAAAPQAAAFAGAAIDNLSEVATGADIPPTVGAVAEELPSFERVMRDVRATGKRPRTPTEIPWQQPRVEATPAASRLAPLPGVPKPIPMEEEQAAEVRLEWEQQHDPSTQGVPHYSELPVIQYEAGSLEEEVPAAKPLSPEGRARAEALARALARKHAIKFGLGFRYDFLSSVADYKADEFAIYRFPISVDIPAASNTHFRLTAEPTLVDNDRIDDAGIAGMATLTGLTLGTDMLVLSGGIGGTPLGFPRDPYLIGFARLDIKPIEGLTLTPFYERQPVMESLLSLRGEELVDGNDKTFIGKVIQDRFGGRLGFDTPAHIDGVVEAAYSTLQAIRVPDNSKFDAFIGIGRTFDLREYENRLRPGAEIAFFHYEHDLSDPVPDAATSDAEVLAAVQARRTGGGYFSPDAFAQALLRLDFSGPLFPNTLGDATFLLTGKVGGQWINGVASQAFKDTEGGRLAGGVEGILSFPIEEIATLQTSGGLFFADPYNRSFFLTSIVFPLNL